MTAICKYCSDLENKQICPGLECEVCSSFIHLTCLHRPGTPGDFSCDVFFDFVCKECSPENREIFKRNKFPWVNVILLTLHHLSENSYGISNNGYFHYKTHICSFIDRNWHLLFGPQFKQKKNWVGTIAGALSIYSNLMFRSGSATLGETGWWKLLHSFSPAVAAHILQEMSRDKPKGRPRSQLALDKTLFMMKISELGYRDYLSLEPTACESGSGGLGAPGGRKKRRLDSREFGALTTTTLYEHFDSDTRGDVTTDRFMDQQSVKTEVYSDVDTTFTGFHFDRNAYAPNQTQSDSSSLHSYQQSAIYYDSDSHSSFNHQPEPQSDLEEKPQIETKKPEVKPKKIDEKPIIKRETLFSSELNSIELPWLENPPVESEDLVEMSQYEEMQLLKQLESVIPKVKDPEKKAYLYRMKAKLAVRRLKRHKHLPLFDLDKIVKLLGGYVTEESKAVMNTERVLDRFQTSHVFASLCGTIPHASGAVVVCGSGLAPAPVRSPYSGALLKPYIRRDTFDAHAAPAWVRLQEEIMTRAGNKYSRASIDYSYIRPHHVAAINNLCAQFFWSGIDVSEALQYPEYSCVVTYRQLVVGCALLVPGRDAYISFVLTRPGWRRAGIATFMLYHLLQTCTGKDVTLHVSPTNPAIFLYQKFGFKVEELVQDFYEKYYDLNYKGCRHALFLRLVR